MLQDILDATIKHSPGMSTTAACLEARISGSAGRMSTATAVLPLTKEESCTDYHDISDSMVEQKGDRDILADAVSMHGVGVARGKVSAARGEGDAAAAAHAAVVAAAAEEVASAESHSLTQGAMKLVYLLAIQVKRDLYICPCFCICPLLWWYSMFHYASIFVAGFAFFIQVFYVVFPTSLLAMH